MFQEIFVSSSSSSSLSSCARSVTAIGDHSLPILSIDSFPSELSVGRFLVTKLFRLPVYFVRYLPLLLVPQIFPLNICFSTPSALCMCPKNCSCLFLVVLSRYLLYPAISITSSFDFFLYLIIMQQERKMSTT